MRWYQNLKKIINQTALTIWSCALIACYIQGGHNSYLKKHVCFANISWFIFAIDKVDHSLSSTYYFLHKPVFEFRSLLTLQCVSCQSSEAPECSPMHSPALNPSPVISRTPRGSTEACVSCLSLCSISEDHPSSSAVVGSNGMCGCDEDHQSDVGKFVRLIYCKFCHIPLNRAWNIN